MGDLWSFITEKPSSYYIVALEDSETMQISKSDFEQLMLDVPKMERYFRILTQNAYISTLERINQNNSESAEQRYLTFIEKHPEFIQWFPQKYIASYLGITPVFLSILRKKLSKSD